jgi:hypothetical protein
MSACVMLAGRQGIWQRLAILIRQAAGDQARDPNGMNGPEPGEGSRRAASS